MNYLRHNKLLAVNEIFGPTFQGEGKNFGMPVMFLRMAGCNQHCVWCDTPYTWRFTDKFPHVSNTVFDPKKEVHSMTIEQVAEQLSNSSVKNLVVSGGEPMLQQDGLFSLFRVLKRDYDWKHIEMETAGSIQPYYSNDIDLFTVSLKLENSGNPRSLSINPRAIDELVRRRQNRVFKFVVSHPNDFEEINKLVKEFNLDNVYIMPEGINSDKIQETMQEIASECLSYGYNLTTRMQILIYGNQRGV